MSFRFIFFVFVLLVFWSCADRSEQSSETSFINEVRLKQISLERLTDSLTRCLDTSFYAEYRSKSDKYFSYFLRNDSIRGAMSEAHYPGCLQDAFTIAQTLDVNSIWDNRADSVCWFGFSRGIVLVLRSPSSNSLIRIGNAKRISERVYLKQ